jgi:PIN domain nuclease of toxin-antitoxin system
VGRVEVIIVDTHVLLWWSNAPHLISQAADNAFSDADVVAVSAITAWEIAILRSRRRIEIENDALQWLQKLTSSRGLRVLPVTIEIGALAAELHELLRDPIDCLIAATALTHNVPLVTKDDRIRRSGVVTTIW